VYLDKIIPNHYMLYLDKIIPNHYMLYLDKIIPNHYMLYLDKIIPKKEFVIDFLNKYKKRNDKIFLRIYSYHFNNIFNL
jgi:hypothetical protein